MKSKRSSDEFKEGMSEWPAQLSRRDFLHLSGATLALAGITGCTRPPRDPVYPYIQRPEDLVPGKPTYFATARVRQGYATGILVETHLGRPTKIEGNPDHPASLGVASTWMQASLLDLYDPDRSQQVKFKGQSSSWAQFQNRWKEMGPDLASQKGEGFVILTELSTSPTLQSQMDQLKKQFPKSRWIQYEPLFRPMSLMASQEIFGQALMPLYDFKSADVIVSFDADFLAAQEYPVVSARDYMERRRQWDKGQAINQLFVFESALSLTGLKANQRRALAPDQVENTAFKLFESLQGSNPSKDPALSDLIGRIKKNRGRCLFIAGSQQPLSVHRICHSLNAEFADKCVSYRPSEISIAQTGLEALRSVLKDFSQQSPRALFIIGSNPVYNLPPDLKIQEFIQNSSFSAFLGCDENETAQLCQWSLPMSDELEAWSDATSFEGSQCLLQPVIQPLYDTRNIHEFVNFLLTSKETSSYDILKSQWQKKWGSAFDENWRRSLQKGVIEKNQIAKLRPKARKLPQASTTASGSTDLFQIVWKPSLALYDGRSANNAWLQELPDPLTQITWDNVAQIGSHDLNGKKVKNGQVIEIQCKGLTLKAPVWVTSGLPEKTIVLTLGYGRTHSGRVGTNIGFNAFSIQSSDSPDFSQAQVRVTDAFATLASAQTHQSMEYSQAIQTTETLEAKKSENSLYPNSPVASPSQEPAWSMVIDLDSCIGCSACVIACQSENNIPVVGKKGVLLGREMHWIRVDRYVETGFQPVPCMHCEKAPCEPVCPVGATVHSTDGLNQMIYNRCVGTRYCSNNCPYKVRRFNFLHFANYSNLERLQKNPDVSIRPRGVMEKCTYCVQRINETRIQAKLQERKIQDGEIQTACQQTCPTRAIVFGDLNDSKSQVRQLKSSPRNYSLLEELGTKPRTTYLAQLSKKDLEGGSHA